MAYTFISGATGGIGKAFAIACAKKGYNLFLTGRSIGKLSVLKSEILSCYNVQVEIFACDLSSEKARAKLIADIDKNNIKFSQIINVAGVDTQKAFMEYTTDKVLFQLRVNAEATICLTHALLSRREEKAELITVSSMSGTTPMPYFALYSATKDMLINFSKSLHYELKKEGVKVTVIAPGGVPTRQDIIEDIKGQGLWGKLASKSPIFVAEKSLKAVKRNKLMYIPGYLNRFLYRLIKILPQKLVLRFIANRWKKQTKDAF
ncbi:MAG: SDR family NAD(P)-dependent oxidoreductase [Clostridiales bacterium]|nr:SDR family NAD(P)-dependent oxidoreductase [Clostridiales bacterium]